jgi:hypothetical protein
MKNLMLLISFFCSISNNHIEEYAKQDYIQIQFTGIEQYSSKQYFIVKKSVDFATIEERLKELKLQTTPPLTNDEKIRMWKLMFNTAITDNVTFLKIIEFVDKNQKFYSENGTSHYTIIVNGTRYRIILKLQKKFFNKLAIYLKNKNCDKAVVKQINSY